MLLQPPHKPSGLWARSPHHSQLHSTKRSHFHLGAMGAEGKRKGDMFCGNLALICRVTGK